MPACRSRVAVAVGAAGSAQEVQAQQEGESQQAQHVDLQHSKFILAVIAKVPIPNQYQDQPLGGDDDLDCKEAQGQRRLAPAPGGSKSQQGQGARQQAGEGQREEHAEEEHPGGASLGSEAHDEGEGGGENPSSSQQEHGHTGHRTSHAVPAAMLPGGAAEPQRPDSQAQEEKEAEQEAGRGQRLQDDAPGRLAVTQVAVDWVKVCAAALNQSYVGRTRRGRGCGWVTVVGLAEAGEGEVEEEEEEEETKTSLCPEWGGHVRVLS